jgi:apolipoprotein D and lipocalin family protein
MKNQFFFALWLCLPALILATPALAGSSPVPPVAHVDLARLCGTWYEVARLPNKYEKDMVNVTMTLRARQDGKLQAINRGYRNSPKGKVSESHAIIWAPDPGKTGDLKIRFNPLMSANFRIVAIDSANYQHMIAAIGKSDFLWLLSKSSQIEKSELQNLIAIANRLGYSPEKLQIVSQDWNYAQKNPASPLPEKG